MLILVPGGATDGDNFFGGGGQEQAAEHGVPNLETDLWNCRGQMKSTPDFEVQNTFSGYFHSPMRSASGVWMRRPSSRRDYANARYRLKIDSGA
jgi:hypothetical protein